MKSTIFIRHLCILLLFTAWQSCGKEDGPDKQDDGIRIENLDTKSAKYKEYSRVCRKIYQS